MLLFFWTLCTAVLNADASRKISSTVVAEATDQSINSKQVLTELKNVIPNKLIRDGVEVLLEIDWNKNVEDQLRTKAVKALGVTLTAVHPLLGASFSFLAGVMGWIEEPNAGVVNSMTKQVDKMITAALAEFTHELNEKDIQGLMNLINKPYPQWDAVANQFNLMSPSIFDPSCWSDTINYTRCKKWRVETGAARALTYEIQYMDLMVQVRAVMKQYGSKYSMHTSNLRSDIIHASPLLLDHAQNWSTHRFHNDLFVRANVTKGTYSYWIYQGYDKFLHSKGNRKDKYSYHDEYEGSKCSRSPRSERRRTLWPEGSVFYSKNYGNSMTKAKEAADKSAKACLDQWTLALQDQMQTFWDGAKAIEKVKNLK